MSFCSINIYVWYIFSKMKNQLCNVIKTRGPLAISLTETTVIIQSALWSIFGKTGKYNRIVDY